MSTTSSTESLPQGTPGDTTHELERPRRRIWLATLLWVSLLLGVTLERSLPAVPSAAAMLVQGVGVVTAVWVISVRPSTALRHSVPSQLLWGFIAIPVVGAGLALFRGEPGDSLNHAASALSLVAASKLDSRTMAESAYRALLSLIGASLVIGLAVPATVDPSARAFLRPLYDGRLRGLLGQANILGLCAVLLIIFSLVALTGRQRFLGISVAVAGILAASSQTAGLAATAVLVVAVILALRRAGAGVILGLLGIGAASAFTVWTFVWVNRPRSTGLDDLWTRLTFSSRVDIWDFVLRQDIPFTGMGQSRIELLFDQTRIRGATGVSSVHNVVLDAYARDGVPGLAAFLVMIASLTVVVVTHRADLALLPLTALIVEGFAEVAPTHVPFYAFFFMAFAVTLNTSSNRILGGRGRAAAGPERSNQRGGGFHVA